MKQLCLSLGRDARFASRRKRIDGEDYTSESRGLEQWPVRPNQGTYMTNQRELGLVFEKALPGVGRCAHIPAIQVYCALAEEGMPGEGRREGSGAQDPRGTVRANAGVLIQVRTGSGR